LRPPNLIPPDPPLTDGVIALRAAAELDVDGLLGDGADGETQRWVNIPIPYTQADAREELDRLMGCWDDPAAPVALVIADPAVSGYLGTMMLNHQRPDGIVELGYSVHPAARGRGFAGRALTLVAPWAFAQLRAERLEARTDPDNVASQRALERAGFTREGLERGSRSVHGVRRDMICWALLPDDIE
jgi:RimJ/RimL family protein N-acetyltransferase